MRCCTICIGLLKKTEETGGDDPNRWCAFIFALESDDMTLARHLVDDVSKENVSASLRHIFKAELLEELIRGSVFFTTVSL